MFLPLLPCLLMFLFIIIYLFLSWKTYLFIVAPCANGKINLLFVTRNEFIVYYS